MIIENAASFLPFKLINAMIYQQILKLFINLAELNHIKIKNYGICTRI